MAATILETAVERKPPPGNHPGRGNLACVTHAHRKDTIPVAFKATGLAPRVSPFGLVTVAACRTLALRVAMPAGCTTLIPGDAWAMRPTRHDTVLFGLLLQVIDVLGRTPTGSGAGCGDGRSGGGARRPGCRQKKGLDAALLAEIPHLAGALVA